MFEAAYWIAASLAAMGCDFNRSMQHLISNYREEDVENEAATELELVPGADDGPYDGE